MLKLLDSRLAEENATFAVVVFFVIGLFDHPRTVDFGIDVLQIDEVASVPLARRGNL